MPTTPLAAPPYHRRESPRPAIAAAHSEPPSPLANSLRPLEYWLDRHPPGWLAHIADHDADPVRVASEIEHQAAAFLRWIRLPEAERWDAYWQQILAATLFSRYRGAPGDSPGSPPDVPLLDLPWPKGAAEIRRYLVDLQRLLGPPLAVFKATRSAIAAEEYPTTAEVLLAVAALESMADELEAATAELSRALERYFSIRSQPPCNCDTSADSLS